MKFYPSDDNFTQALLVMPVKIWTLVTLVTAISVYEHYKPRCAAIDRFLHICRFPAWEYRRRLSAGWVSVVNIKTNQIIFSCFLLQCCVGLSSFTFLLYLEYSQDWPTVFRLSEHIICPQQRYPPAQRGRGEPSPWLGCAFLKRRKLQKLLVFYSNILLQIS